MNLPSESKADRCCQRLPWDAINTEEVRKLIQMAKDEDLNACGLLAGTATPGDPSSELLPASLQAKATLKARESLVVCGSQLASEIVSVYDPALRFSPLCQDGDLIGKGDRIGTIKGPVRSLLSAERPLLNFLQMLSGIAKQTRHYVEALGNSSTRLLDTRKTTPGYRILEKYAVACGGGWNHRMGLFDRIMLKDNHIAAFGSNPLQATITAVATARERHPEMLIEMEVDTLDQIDSALEAKVDIVLLDNFTTEQLKAAVSKIQGRIITEASGGITIDTLPELSQIGLDFISTGALVHQSTWVDIGLDWE